MALDDERSEARPTKRGLRDMLPPNHAVACFHDLPCYGATVTHTRAHTHGSLHALEIQPAALEGGALGGSEPVLIGTADPSHGGRWTAAR